MSWFGLIKAKIGNSPRVGDSAYIAELKRIRGASRRNETVHNERMRDLDSKFPNMTDSEENEILSELDDFISEFNVSDYTDYYQPERTNYDADYVWDNTKNRNGIEEGNVRPKIYGHYKEKSPDFLPGVLNQKLESMKSFAITDAGGRNKYTKEGLKQSVENAKKAYKSELGRLLVEQKKREKSQRVKDDDDYKTQREKGKKFRHGQNKQKWQAKLKDLNNNKIAQRHGYAQRYIGRGEKDDLV